VKAAASRPALLPLSTTLLVGSAVIFFIVWGAGVSRHAWGQAVPDSTHTYPVRFKGGETLYFSAALGWVLKNGLWVSFAVLTVAGGAELIWGTTKRSRAV
jgi:hypothetical protein